jgi:site-specific DNA recombinase
MDSIDTTNKVGLIGKDGFPLYDSDHSLTRKGLFLINTQWNSNQLLRRMHDALMIKLRAGYIIISVPPYGYCKDRKELERIEDELSIVKKIFAMVVEGKSCLLIKKELNANSMPYRDGKPWNRGAISRTIRNSIYAGVFFYGRTHNCSDGEGNEKRQPTKEKDWIRVDVSKLACIDRSTYNLANEKLSTRRHLS